MAVDPLDLDSPLEFREAVEAFRRRVPMTRQAWDALVAEAKERAFMVSNVAQVDVIQQVFSAIDSAVKNGDTLEDFKRTIGPALEASWSGTVANPAARLETIFRTNVQTAYAAGHAEQRDNPVIKRRRPFNQYRAINDARTSAVCRPLNGVVRPADDPWWAENSPPRHFNCFVPGTLVEGSFVGALRARYAGQVVELQTRGGRRLTVTVNHPVLTPQGFVPAHALREGQHVVAHRGVVEHAQGSVAVREHEQHDPAPIEQVFRAIGEQSGLLGTCRTAPLDLHGDALRVQGDVEIVGSYVELLRDAEAAAAELSRKGIFAVAATAQASGHRLGALDLGFQRLDAATRRGPSSGALALDGGAVVLEGIPLQALRIGAASQIDASRYQSAPEGIAADLQFLAELQQRHAAAVTLDEIVHIERRDFLGHVYDLQAVGGWIVADGIFSSNCRCRIVPLTKEQAEAAGVTASLDGLPPAQEGFGAKPSLANWTPEKAGYSPELWAEVEKKLKRSA